MPNGEGLGSFAEGFQSSFLPTLNYRNVLAQQQARAGIQAEELRLKQERDALNAELTKLQIGQADLKLKQTQGEAKEAERTRRAIEGLVGPEPNVPKLTDEKGELTGTQGIEVSKGVLAKKEHIQRALTASIAPERLLPPTRAEELDIQAQEADIAKTLAETEGLLAPAGGETFTERGFKAILNPDTPKAELDLWMRKLFPEKGGKATIQGISLADIRATLNLIYPLDFGERTGVPEGVDENSYEFLVHGAELIKQGLGKAPTPIDDEDKEIENEFKINPDKKQ